MSGKESRRGFLKGIGAGLAAGTLQGSATGAQEEVQALPRPVLPSVEHHSQLEAPLAPGADEGAWDGVPDGLHGSFVSKDAAYFRDQVPDVPLSRTLKVQGWRGERITAVVLLFTRNGAKQVRVGTGPLTSQAGAAIGADRISARFVRYVLTNLPYGSAEGSCGPLNPTKAWLMPDPLDSARTFDIPERTARPVWLSIDIPSDAKAGNYQSSLQITGGTPQSLTFDLELEVQEPVLPPPSEWAFQLDLWQNPSAVAAYHGVEPWSSAHIEILKPHLRRLADAGAKFITTYAVHSPWKDDTYTADATMVEWIRKADGTWRFDYTIFDRYVELALECGITRAITVYTPLPWKHRHRFLDETTGSHEWREWPPASPEFEAFWSVFLQDLRLHLLDRGWFDRTYIGINENPLEDTLKAIAVVKKDSADWKLTYAGNWHPELSEWLDDYCVIIDQPPPKEVLEKRKAEGKTTTFYVCCYPARPNNYPFSPPAENVWMGWHTAAMGYDGFLRWAYDSWTADPLRDARHVFWPAGDCFMVYPGNRSSIRFERLREGIADFEKLRVLKAHLEAKGDEKALARLKSTLERFTYESVQSIPAADTVNAGRQVLGELAQSTLQSVMLRTSSRGESTRVLSQAPQRLPSDSDGV